MDDTVSTNLGVHTAGAYALFLTISIGTAYMVSKKVADVFERRRITRWGFRL